MLLYQIANSLNSQGKWIHCRVGHGTSCQPVVTLDRDKLGLPSSVITALQTVVKSNRYATSFRGYSILQISFKQDVCTIRGQCCEQCTIRSSSCSALIIFSHGGISDPCLLPSPRGEILRWWKRKYESVNEKKYSSR